MTIPCKVCNSDKKDYIEQMILQGNSDTDISKTLKDMGVDISFTSIKRHKLNHMMEHIELIKENAGEKGNKKYGRDDSHNPFTIATHVIYDEIDKELESFNYDNSATSFTYTSLMLNRIVKNQCAIVISLQDKYIKGECKYPHEQITGLDKIQSLLIKHESFQNKSYEYMKTIFKKREDLFKNENRHLDNELEVKLWIESRPYIKGHIFNLLKHLNYNIDDTMNVIHNFYSPFITDNLKNIDKYRSQEYHIDYDIIKQMIDLYLDENLIKDITDLIVKNDYESAYKLLPI